MMMGGYGFYGYGGGPSSSASNLSPSAAPFVFDRSVPKSGSNQLVDLTEIPSYDVTVNPSLHDWVNPASTAISSFVSGPGMEFQAAPSSNPYGYISLSGASGPHFGPVVSAGDHAMYSQSPVSATVTIPYYPSYVPPAIGGDVSLPVHSSSAYDFDLFTVSSVETTNETTTNDYKESASGLVPPAQWTNPWKESWDEKQTERARYDESFCLEENYMNQGSCPSKDMYKYGAASHGSDMAGRENDIHSPDMSQFDGKSVTVENPKFLQRDYSIASTPPSSFLNSETYLPQTVNNCKNKQVSYDAASEMCSGKFSISSHDSMKCFASVIIRPPEQDTMKSSGSLVFKHSEPHKMTTLNEKLNKDSIMKVPSHPVSNSRDKLHFDPTQLSFHLQQHDLSFMQVSSSENEDPQSNGIMSKDALQPVVGMKHGTESPQINLVDLNLLVDDSMGVNMEHYSDGYNPAVDSPCWKGSLCLSPFGESEAVTVQRTKSLDASHASNIQAAQSSTLSNDGIKVSPDRSCKNPIYHDNISVENDVGLINVLKVAKVSFGAVGDAENLGSRHMVQGFDSHESLEELPLPNNSANNSDFKPCFFGKESVEEGKSTNEKICSPGSVASDVGVIIGNDYDADNASTAVEDASSQINASYDVESRQKMHVEVLINSIHNLSEVLLLHCTKEACQIKREHYELLEDAIENLHSCMHKKLEMKTTNQESSNPRTVAPVFLEDAVRLQKGSCKSQNIWDEEHNTIAGNEGEKLSSSAFVRDAANMVQDNNMIQAIKKILDENFDGLEETDPQNLLFKNLWLEAEASLCTVNYMARYNRMKAEMEKSIPQKTNGKSPSMENNASSIFSSEPGRVDTFVADDTKGGLEQDLSNSKINLPEDFMARLHVLQSRLDNISSADENLSSPEDPHDLNKDDDKLENEAIEVAKAGNPLVQGTPKSTTSSHTNNIEASIISRYSILRHRLDNSSPVNIEEGQPQNVGFNYGYLGSCFSKSEGKVLQADAASFSTDKLTADDFHLFKKDDPVLPYGTTSKAVGEMPSVTSSDWEHVLKEELLAPDY